MAQFAFDEKGPTALAFIDGIIMFEGGLPIMVGDVHVGVSGGSGEQDGMCAQAGLDAAAPVFGAADTGDKLSPPSFSIDCTIA